MIQGFSRTNGVAIDVGAFATRFYCAANGVLMDAPSVALLDLDTMHADHRAIRCYGHAAIEQYQKSPAGLRLINPLQADTRNNLGYSAAMLSNFLQKSIKQKLIARKPQIALTLPCGIDSLLAEQLHRACFDAGASRVHQLDNGMAIALGLAAETEQRNPSVAIDFGSRGSRVYAVDNDEIIAATSLFCGGDYLDQQLVDGIRSQFGVLVTTSEARNVKHQVGNAMPAGYSPQVGSSYLLSGLEIATNQQLSFRVSTESIGKILQTTMHRLSASINSAIADLPDSLQGTLAEHGVMLTGGGAQLAQIDQLVMEATTVPVEIARQPTTTTVTGCGVLFSRIYDDSPVAQPA